MRRVSARLRLARAFWRWAQAAVGWAQSAEQLVADLAECGEVLLVQEGGESVLDHLGVGDLGRAAGGLAGAGEDDVDLPAVVFGAVPTPSPAGRGGR